MSKFRTINVHCSCGCLLARYNKGGKGRLRKMYFERIDKDLLGIFLKEPPLPLNTDVFCPGCGKRVGTVQIMSGKYVIKINQGVVRE